MREEKEPQWEAGSQGIVTHACGQSDCSVVSNNRESHWSGQLYSGVGGETIGWDRKEKKREKEFWDNPNPSMSASPASSSVLQRKTPSWRSAIGTRSHGNGTAMSETAVSPGMRVEGARGLPRIQTCSAGRGQGQGLGPCLLGALLRPTNPLHSPWWPHPAR